MPESSAAPVITGVGLIAAPGVGVDAVWERLRRDPPRPRPWSGPEPTEEISFAAYQAPEYELGDLGVDARTLRWLADERLEEARDLRHLLGATALALADAGLGGEVSAVDPAAAVIVGVESPGFEDLSLELYRLGRDAPPPREPEERFDLLTRQFFQLNTFLPPYYIARAFGFGGLSLFVNSACTSGLSALDLAAAEVRSGRSRIAVAVAADDPLSASKYLWFERLGLYSATGEVRPFDREQDGIVFGDGGAAVVVEAAAGAEARGAEVYAEYAGAAFAQDGWKVTVPSPLKMSATAAARQALGAAGVAAPEVDLVVPHGVGTAASDGYEARVMHELFGGGGGGGEDGWPAVTAFKPLVGHTLGGSALLDVALLLAAMRRGAVPPTLGHRQRYARDPVPLVTDWQQRPLTRALKLSCGFAGYHGAALFQRPGEPTGDGA